MTPDFLDIAMLAYLTVWRDTGAFPPDSEAVRRLAYWRYEEELAACRRASESAD